MKSIHDMKYLAGRLLITGFLLGAAASGLRAQDYAGKNYIAGNFGATFIPDVVIKNSGGLTATFNPGARGTLVFGHDISESFFANWFGYDASERFALEFETGVLWNSIDKIGGGSISASGTSMDLYQIPALVNLVCKAENDDRISTYFGVGAGGIGSILESSGPIASGSDNDFTFAYQAMVGVGYSLSDRINISLTYKFLGTLDHSWTIAGNPIETEAIFSHSVLAVFTWKL